MTKRNAKQEILDRRKKAAANKKKDTAKRRAGVRKQIKATKKPKKQITPSTGVEIFLQMVFYIYGTFDTML